MKNKIFSVILCILMIAVVFTGCTPKQTNSDVNIDSTIYSNGSIAVRKDNYLFTVNGYQGYSVITDKSKNKGIDLGNLVRIKINEDGSLNKDEDGNIIQETICDKLCGFEYTNLFIYDDFIYFASPNTNKDSSGSVKNEYVTFYKVRLNGNDLTELYTANGYTSSSNYIFTKVDGNVYLILNNNKKLLKINVSIKNIKEEVIKESITEVVLPFEKNIEANKETSDFYKKIYYTCDREDSLKSGNLLYSYNIATGEKKVLFDKAGTKISLKAYANENLYYTLDTPSTYYYSNDLKGESFIENGKKLNYIVDISNFLPVTNLEDNTLLGNVYTYDSKTYINYEGKVTPTKISSSSVTPLFAFKEYIIYESSSNLKLIKINEDGTTKELTITSLSIKKDILSYVDICEDYIYFYAKPNSDATNYYLYRVNLKEELQDKTSYTTELIGKIKDSDQKKETGTTN